MTIDDIGIYLPKYVETNEMLAKEFPQWESEKISSKIGIGQRHIAEKNETAVDMAVLAAEKVLNDSNKGEIDFILFCTQSPDHFLPTSACIIQDRLGLATTTGALDFNLGCSGYIYGLALAKGLLTTGISKKLLLITAETYSKHINELDVANRAIFGDAAAVTLLSPDTTNDIGQFVLGSDGAGKDNLIVKNGAFRSGYVQDAQLLSYGTESQYTENNIYMNGPEIFNFTIANIPLLVNEVLEKNEITIDQIDFFIFHQANKYMLNYLRRKIKIPEDKFYIDMQNTGNTVSATIPIALKSCLDQGLVKKNDLVILVGFGVGYSWGATIISI